MGCPQAGVSRCKGALCLDKGGSGCIDDALGLPGVPSDLGANFRLLQGGLGGLQRSLGGEDRAFGGCDLLGVRAGQDEGKLGMNAIERVMTQYGELELVMDRWCPTSEAYILESGKVGFYTLRSFETYELARSGDSLKGEVVGEFSLLAANDKAHGKITGITV